MYLVDKTPKEVQKLDPTYSLNGRLLLFKARDYEGAPLTKMF